MLLSHSGSLLLFVLRLKPTMMTSTTKCITNTAIITITIRTAITTTTKTAITVTRSCEVSVKLAFSILCSLVIVAALLLLLVLLGQAVRFL